MRLTHIERKIRDKINDWLASIEDEQLREDLGEGVIVTGGAIVSMLLNEKVNDYDIYLRDKKLAERVADYYVEQFKERELNAVRFGYTETVADIKRITREDGRVMVVVQSAGLVSEGGADGYRYFEMIDDPNEREAAAEGFVMAAAQAKDEVETLGDIEPEPYRPIFLTSNAITLSDDIQIVIRFYGKPSEIHANYDFEHCKSYWRSWGKIGNQLTVLKSALVCVLEQRLLYTGSRYPLASLFRLRKFQKRGWYYDLGQVLKIAMQVAELDLKNPRVLEDQLVGMDIAYFMEIISRIKQEGVESVDSTYVAKLVDEIYGEY